jgi:pimeloyl-ACP methyl ester carboxylesterase
MSIVALNGWAQPHDGLADILPEDALHIDYSAHKPVANLWEELRALNPKFIVGWSLGGQLAVRAVLEGIIAPKALVLIGTPYRFVASPEVPSGMGKNTYALFVKNYTTQPFRTARRFSALVAHGDKHSQRIITEQEKHQPLMGESDRWLPWLHLLEDWQPPAGILETMPPTLVVYGVNDGIVNSVQSEAWLNALPQVQLLPYTNAGHAPHMHDAPSVREEIFAFAREHGVEGA